MKTPVFGFSSRSVRILGLKLGLFLVFAQIACGLTPGLGSFTLSNDAPVWDATPPAAPAVQLNWTRSFGATSYQVYRDGFPVGSPIGGTTFYDRSGLSAGQSYSYYVSAHAPGTGVDSNTITVSIPSTIVPSSPGAFTLSNSAPVWDPAAPAGPAVQLTWSASSGAISYQVYRAGVPIGGATAGTSFYNSTGLTAGQSYSYYVVATNAGGTTTSNTATISIPTSIVPTTSLGAFTLSNSAPVWDTTSSAGPAVQLSWTQSVGANAYEVYRDRVKIYPTSGSFTGTAFRNDTGLSGGQKYTYYVVAKNDSESLQSNSLSITMPPAPGAQTPILTVSPTSVSVSSDAGSSVFRVSDAALGSLTYSSAIAGSAPWLTIASDGSPGTVTVSYTSNLGAQRMGTLVITAGGAGGSPAAISITQAAAAVSTPFKDGAHVIATGKIFVRDNQLARKSSAAYDQYTGVHGRIVGVAMTGTAGGVTGNWWNVAWDAGLDGWCAESVLAIAPAEGDIDEPAILTDAHYASSANVLWSQGAAPAAAHPPRTILDVSWLGNGTWYALGRMLELGYNPTQLALVSDFAEDNWAYNAFYNASSGITFDVTPAPGDIAQTVKSQESYFAQVAVVEGVSADGQTITVSESGLLTNDSSLNFLWRRRTTDRSWFQNYIHVSKGSTAAITAPASHDAPAGAAVTLKVATTSQTQPAVQWQLNGVNLVGATATTFAVSNVQPATAGLYNAIVPGLTGSAFTDPTILGVATANKVIGAGTEIAHGVFVASNGNTFDQVLPSGGAVTITAERGKITRTSFVDLANNIVQVEFSGAGSLSLVLDSLSGPAVAANYNQPSVTYMKGHAGIVITGADDSTNVAVFSVGPQTAVDQSIFKPGVVYDGVANLAFIAIASANGKFGGVRTANGSYYASKGLTGIYAPGVEFTGPVYIGDINASGSATPVLLLGSADGSVLVTGGDMFQNNGQPVKVHGITHLQFKDGSTSHGVADQPAQYSNAKFLQDDRDVTALIVVNPPPP